MTRTNVGMHQAALLLKRRTAYSGDWWQKSVFNVEVSSACAAAISRGEWYHFVITVHTRICIYIVVLSYFAIRTNVMRHVNLRFTYFTFFTCFI